MPDGKLNRGSPTSEPSLVGNFRWRLHAGDGSDLRDTEAFVSKEEAEAWMAGEWAALLHEGAEEVSLMSGDEVLYRMGLREA